MTELAHFSRKARDRFRLGGPCSDTATPLRHCCEEEPQTAREGWGMAACQDDFINKNRSGLEPADLGPTPATGPPPGTTGVAFTACETAGHMLDTADHPYVVLKARS